LNDTVIAVSPSSERDRAFPSMLDDFDARDPHNTAFYAPARQDLARYVQSLLDEEAGSICPKVSCRARTAGWSSPMAMSSASRVCASGSTRRPSPKTSAWQAASANTGSR
jgi:hypothetical protein